MQHPESLFRDVVPMRRQVRVLCCPDNSCSQVAVARPTCCSSALQSLLLMVAAAAALCLVGQHNCQADLQQAAPLGAYLGCFPLAHATSLPGVKETGVRRQVLHMYRRAGTAHSSITQYRHCCCHREHGTHPALCMSVWRPVGRATTPSPSSAQSCAAGAQPPSLKHTSS